jgi:hypothetical protein
MRLTNMFSALSCILLMCGVGFAGQLPEKQYSKIGINRMFRDAHTPDPPSYSHSEIRKMIHEAANSEDYARLADYFDYQAVKFEQKSRDQVKELERLLALHYHARNYPEQVEYTRQLIKRYKSQADEYSSRADSYRDRATANGETKESVVVPSK